MQVRLLLQPFAADARVGAALAERAGDASGVWLLSAWAQESGLRHLRKIVAEVRGRGGYAEAILGLDQGIATYEGLRMALRTFDDVYLFRDGARTFHPKLYVIENEATSRLIVGSSNVTKGGFYDNFEASAAIDLDRSTPGDVALRTQARAYFDSFIAPGMPSRRLDSALLNELRAERLVIASAERTLEERALHKRAHAPLRRIFGGRVAGLPSAPHVQRSSRATRSRVSPRAVSTAAPSSRGVPATPPGASATAVEISWWRKLTVSDAMKKPPPSHQRKDVILNQGPHPIDQVTFFRQHFFQGVPWSQTMMRSYRGRPRRPKELAVVPFDVIIGRRRLGLHNLTVDHALTRVHGRGNSPTWLNWSSIGEEVARGNYVGWYLLLERLMSGTFRLTLRRTEPGSAVIPPAARR